MAGGARVVDGKLVLATDSSRLDSELLKHVVERIVKIGKVKKLDYWVYLFGTRGNRLSRLVLLSLIGRGIIMDDGKAYHWGAQQYPDGQPVWMTKYLLKRQIRDELFCGKDVDENTVAILGLMETCGLLEHIFTRDEIIAARRTIRRLVKEDTANRELLNQILTAIGYAVSAAISI